MSYEPPSVPSTQNARPVSRRYRKFCVVVDGSPESKAAIRFAAGRAAHTVGGRVTLFHAIAPQEGGHWVAVKERMEAEARQEAEELVSYISSAIFDYVGLRSEIIISEGDVRKTLQSYLAHEDSLFALILGASETGPPGALVEYFSGAVAGTLAFPVVIVPGALDPARIDEIV